MANSTYKTFSETITTGNNTHIINKESESDYALGNTIIFNDGPGDINIKLDFGDGNFGSNHVMKSSDEPLKIDQDIERMRIIYSGTNASYRILAY